MVGARAVAALGALVVAAALASQLGLTVTRMMAEGASPVAGTWRYFAYFTILTNIMVCTVMTRAALKPEARDGVNDPRVELMAVASILFVGAVYHLLLASRWDPQGLQKVTDVVLHTVSPCTFALFWLLRRNGVLGWRDALYAALWPIAYCAYLLARAALDGFYPYYFIDPNEVGWPRLFINATALSAEFVVGAGVLVAADRALSQKREVRSSQS